MPGLNVDHKPKKKGELEIGFDKMVCTKCTMPCIRCTVCHRLLYRIVPHSCPQTVEELLEEFHKKTYKRIGGCVRADMRCCDFHDKCRHEFILASRRQIRNNNGDWP